MAKLRIVIVDGDHIVQNGLRDLFSTRKTWTVCATAANAEEGLALARRHRADIIVCAVNLPAMTGLEMARRAGKEVPEAKVLLRGIHGNGRVIEEARASGAAGYLPTSRNANAILRAVDTIARGGTFFGEAASAAESSRASGAGRRGRALQVTPRERDVVRLIAEGRTSKEIGGILGISVKTVETHRSNLMRKLRLHSVSETVLYAIRHHYVVP